MTHLQKGTDKKLNQQLNNYDELLIENENKNVDYILDPICDGVLYDSLEHTFHFFSYFWIIFECFYNFAHLIFGKSFINSLQQIEPAFSSREVPETLFSLAGSSGVSFIQAIEIFNISVFPIFIVESENPISFAFWVNLTVICVFFRKF